LGGKRSKSFLKPRNEAHTRELVKSSLQYLDWKPDSIITRASIYLDDGYPAKDPVTRNLNDLKNVIVLRNYIAHDSLEAKKKYTKFIQGEFTTSPIYEPYPGQFLRTSTRKNKKINYLEKYLKTIDTVLKEVFTG
jgi:hypothetical protein